MINNTYEEVSSNLGENWIWVEDEEYCYLPSKINEITSDFISVHTYFDSKNYKEKKLSKNHDFNYIDPSSLKGLDDLLLLSDFNKQTLLYNTRINFINDKIYSFIGHSILIAVNPYKTLSIYNSDSIAYYKNYFKSIRSNVRIYNITYNIFIVN